MGPFIDEAKEHLIGILDRLSSLSEIDMHVGIVEYRDFPPQDLWFVTKVHPLTRSTLKTRRRIRKLSPGGGGDVPEAVYSGIVDACRRLTWRDYSHRVLVLVGDAPPHGFARWLEIINGEKVPSRMQHVDAWARECPSGLDPFSVSAEVEEKNIVLHAIPMHAHELTVKAFTMLSRLTGGISGVSNQGDVMEKIADLLKMEFGQIEFDRWLLKKIESIKIKDVEAIADLVGAPLRRVASSLNRLHRRGILQEQKEHIMVI